MTPAPSAWSLAYWPAYLAAAAVLLLVPEIYALVTNHANTLSDYVWRMLRVRPGQAVGAWDAARLLTFGAWCTAVAWLTGHFWFGLWR